MSDNLELEVFEGADFGSELLFSNGAPPKPIIFNIILLLVLIFQYLNVITWIGIMSTNSASSTTKTAKKSSIKYYYRLFSDLW